jgi:hypothetical protein
MVKKVTEEKSEPVAHKNTKANRFDHFLEP